MIQNRLFIIILTLVTVITAWAQKHTEFVGVPLSKEPAEVVAELRNQGLQQRGSNDLSGRIAGINVWLHIEAAKDSAGCSHLLLTTQHQQGGLCGTDEMDAAALWQTYLGIDGARSSLCPMVCGLRQGYCDDC